MTQQVIATIGCPGCGKSTYSQSFDPKEYVVCTFDDWRQSLWPPHRRTYWDVRATDKGPAAQNLLHEVHYSAILLALENNFSVVAADTHKEEKFALRLEKTVRRFNDYYKKDLKVNWVFFDTPWHILYVRNIARDINPGHRVPIEVLKNFYDSLNSSDAWWRSRENITIKSYSSKNMVDSEKYIIKHWTSITDFKNKSETDKDLAIGLMLSYCSEKYNVSSDVVAEALHEEGYI